MRISFFLVGMALVVGCSSSNAPKYAAPAGEDASLALLRGDGVRLETVDGLNLQDRKSVKLTPGSHEVNFSWTTFKGTIGKTGRTQLNYPFAAGGRYIVKKQDSMFSLKEARFILIDENTGKEIDSVGGQSIFKVF
jgi:hypothetical protein